MQDPQNVILQASRSGKLLHQIDTEDMDVKDQIEMFSLQIVNEKLEFTAAGFFTINYGLLFSVIFIKKRRVIKINIIISQIIGGITTYLIILIQFSADPSESKQ